MNASERGIQADPALDIESRKIDVELRRVEVDAELRRAELAEKIAERNSNEILKREELSITSGRGLHFGTSQATVAAAFLALISAALGGGIQAWTTQDIESGKTTRELEIERSKEKAASKLERQKFEATLIINATSNVNKQDRIDNLDFFLKAGFIEDQDRKIAKLIEQNQVPFSQSPTQGTIPECGYPLTDKLKLGGDDADSIDPDKVILISDDGDQCTRVTPIRHNPVRTRESPDTVLGRLGNVASAFAKFTRPNNTPVWIKVTAIEGVRAPAPGEYLPGVKAVLSLGFASQAVEEEVKTVKEEVEKQKLVFDRKSAK